MIYRTYNRSTQKPGHWGEFQMPFFFVMKRHYCLYISKGNNKNLHDSDIKYLSSESHALHLMP